MTSFTSKQLRWILLGLLGLVAVIFVSVMFIGLSILGSKSQKMVDLKLQSEATENQLTNLGLAKKQIKQYGFFKTVAQEVIPNDKDQATAVLQINEFASAAGFKLQDITFPASTLGLTTSGTPTSVSAQTASPGTVLSQARPVTGIPGLYSVQLTVTPQTDKSLPDSQQVSYDKLIYFLGRIESNHRTAQISQIIVTPIYNDDGSVRCLNFTLTINIFIKP